MLQNYDDENDSKHDTQLASIVIAMFMDKN
jgi:hypothetical protein